MAYPLLRLVASQLRAVQTPVLRRLVLRPSSHPMTLPIGSALVVAPHPDDETFGCGGLIALKRAAGIDVSIIVVTDGSRSQMGGRADRAELIDDRRREILAAVEVLGVGRGNVHFLDQQDGGLSTLSEAAQKALSLRIRRIIEATQATEVYAPNRHDRHPDHEATYRLVRDAMRPEFGDGRASEALLIEYLVWLVWKRPMLRTTLAELRGAARLDVGRVQPIKDRAIEVYRSQLPTMPAGFLPQFRQGEEYYWVDGVGESPSANSAHTYATAEA